VKQDHALPARAHERQEGVHDNGVELCAASMLQFIKRNVHRKRRR
jgi:hypothetical protein